MKTPTTQGQQPGFISRDPDLAQQALFALQYSYPANLTPFFHQHQSAQLLHSTGRAIVVETPQGIWVLPPTRGLWIPPGTPHAIITQRGYTILTLYCPAGLIDLEGQCDLIEVDKLTHDLLTEAARFEDNYQPGGAEERLLKVILDRLQKRATGLVCLPQPKDARLKKLTALLEEKLSEALPLEELCRECGISPKTANRLFIKETGMTYQQWRAEFRLLTAFKKLADNEPVTNIALDLGYQDVSSFIYRFKQQTGSTPARFFQVED